MKISRPASNTIQSSSSSSYIVIMTLVFALLVTTSLELDNASGEGENDTRINGTATANNSDNKTSVQELGDPNCKSPCPPNAEMCIEMCA